LFKRSYQATSYSVFHVTVLLGTFGRGVGGVAAVFNARGLVCGCESRTEVHTVCTGDVFGKQAIKNAYDAGLDKHCTLHTCEGDWLRGGSRSNLAVRDASR
jgi:hypothetical protein